jgi:hypothetical protein
MHVVLKTQREEWIGRDEKPGCPPLASLYREVCFRGEPEPSTPTREYPGRCI